MQRGKATLGCIAACLIVFFNWSFAARAHAAEYRDAIINELNWAGSSGSTADEWIELKNQTAAPIDISLWQIEGAATSGGILTLPSGSNIPVQGFFLIANFAATSSQSTLNVTPDWVTTAVSLRNSSALYRLIDAAGSAIDEADDGAGAPLAGDNATKASMERNRSIASGSIANSWHTSYQRINLDQPALSAVEGFGTPKSENNALPTVTLGRISPASTASGEPNQFSVDYEIQDPDGLGDITQAQLDLRDLGSSLFDLDIHSAFAKYVIEPPSLGNRSWSIVVTDRQGGTKTAANTLPVFQSALGIILSEVLPRPQEGSDFEWIELYNGAAHPIDITNFQLDDVADGGSSPYTLTSGTTINPGSFLVIEKSQHKLNLNDDGDVVRLLDPTGNRIIETPNWGAAEKGSSFALIGTVWQWTTQLTKGALNLATPSVAATTPTSTPTPTPAPEPTPTPTGTLEPIEAQASATNQNRAIVPSVSLRPSPAGKKLVKGISIKRSRIPVEVKPSPLRKVTWILAVMIAVNESALLWSRKPKPPSKLLTLAGR
ncbi:lamin tail domain-containing protein [Candidatus Berkelbacteria bacterium]|nr:lamin tail domain-containing protein [Candidatus Berkelbacteria bacterium]